MGIILIKAFLIGVVAATGIMISAKINYIIYVVKEALKNKRLK